MNTIYIRYEGLSPSWSGDAVTGQIGTLRCSFEFDESWDGYETKYMVVARENTIFDPVELDATNSAYVPEIALRERCYLKIGAVGLCKEETAKRYNGRPCRVAVDQGNLIPDPNKEPDENGAETAYEQIILQLLEKLDKNQGKENAGKALVIGEDGNVTPGEVQSNVQADWEQNDSTAPDYIKWKTHSKSQATGTHYPSEKINVEELGAGTHLIFKPSNANTFRTIYDFSMMRYGTAYAFAYDYQYTKVSNGWFADKQITAELLLTNLQYNLIDSKNYSFPGIIGTVYVILDLNTLAEDRKALFPEIGIYLEVPEDSTKTDRTFTLKVYSVGKLSELYIPDSIARKTDIPSAVETALTEAKESGEFDGEPGKDGYTPVKGKDYFDGDKGDPFTYDDFTEEQLSNLKGERGASGVYVGSGNMPEDCNVQIDPDGVAIDLDKMVNDALYANIDLFKGEKGDPGKAGADGTVTFDELTDAQKSQLTEGITEDLASKMQNESLSAVKITASGLFAEEAHATMVSAETFTPETLKNFTVIDKCAVTNGNYYNRGILVGLRKDNSNYIALSVTAYTITLDNVVSGVKTTKTYGSVADSITNASDVCSKIDLVRKKVEMHALINGVNTVIVDEDISGYDLSGLDVFKLETGAGKFRGYQYNIYARINDYFDCVGLMQYHFYMSDYNALPVENGIKEIYEPTGLNLGGTITNTISATHKISSAEMAAENYFAMQMINPSVPIGSNFTTRFRIKSKSDDMYIKIGAGASRATIVDESGVCVWSVLNGANTLFYPDVNKWYYLVTTIPGQGANYSSAYGMRAKGTFTIEAEALYGCGTRSQNMCAETWNGQYFTGALPFKGAGVKFVAYNNFPYNGTLGGNYTPIKATRMDASGYIAMYTGSEWIAIGTR